MIWGLLTCNLSVCAVFFLYLTLSFIKNALFFLKCNKESDSKLTSESHDLLLKPVVRNFCLPPLAVYVITETVES